MRRLRVHVVYERGADRLGPYSTAYIRLIRPLSHASVRGALDVTFGRDYLGEPVDAVIVDRLWRPGVDRGAAEHLVARVRGAGARLIHALDDNFLDLALDRPSWGTRDAVDALHYLVRAADGLLVSTDRLGERLAAIHPRVAVVPNALDERLLDARLADPALDACLAGRPMDPGHVVVGYMGTFTHDADLGMIVPALRAVLERHAGRASLEILGVAGRSESLAALADLPLRVLRLEPAQMAYPVFLPWFTQRLGWHVGLAPLVDTPFTRTKSDIKLLDYAAAGVAGIYSRVPAYAGSVRHGETGWLAHHTVAAWEAALEHLITDAALRAAMSRAARDYVAAERTLARRGTAWVDALTTLCASEHVGTSLPALQRDPDRPDGVVGPSPEADGSPAAARRRALRLAVLCEHGHGGDARPLASSHVRLVRPLSHPAVSDRIDVTWSTRFEPHNFDAVVLDRLWRPDVTFEHVRELAEAVRAVGAALIYALDDNLLDLPAERSDWPSAEHVAIVRWLLAEADGIVVGSPALARRIAGFGTPVVVLPNALDERLLGSARPAPLETPFGRRPVVVGYMGTPTHDDDLTLVLPALTEVAARHPGGVMFEVAGVVGRRATRDRLRRSGLPFRFVGPRSQETEYPLFMTWFTHRAEWDIALAPLADTPFRRCKTDIKFLDYCAIGAACIASDVEPYAATVRHGETGWLTGNTTAEWADGLGALIDDAALRRTLSGAARRYLQAERTLAVRAEAWPEAVWRLVG